MVDYNGNFFGSVIHKSLVLFLIFGVVLSVGSLLSLNRDARYFLGSLISIPGLIETTDSNHYAYAETIGWIDFSPIYNGEEHSIVVADNGLTGYAYSENAGWIKLDYDEVAGATNTNSTDWGVVNDSAGNLSGYAYSENTGWINFDPVYDGTHYQVKIDGSGIFTGYAWGENIGWISFNCSNTSFCASNGGNDYRVLTTWRYPYEQGENDTATITINIQPSGVGIVSEVLDIQPVVLLKDSHGNNMADGTSVTASLASGSGVLLGAKTVTIPTGGAGVATFTDLSYSKAGERFTILFTAGTSTVTSNSVGPLNVYGGGLEYAPSEAVSAPVIETSAVTPEVAPETILEPVPVTTPPATVETIPSVPSTIQSRIMDYVNQALPVLRLSLNQNFPSFNQPITQPPSNLQPTQPPPTQGPAGAVTSNQKDIVQVLEKLLQALKDLLNLAF